MPKKAREMSKRRLRAAAAAASSTENSRGSNSLHSDSEDAESTNSSRTQKKFSSAALCASLGLNDVELEWSDADYQNLTTFNIFVRMVRPQLAAANNRVSQATMIPVLEAKWREFQDSNPFKKKAEEKEEKGQSSAECDDEEDNDQSQNGEGEDVNSSSHSPRTLDRSEDEEPEEEEEEEEEESTKSRRSQGLKIKLSIKPLRKSSRESRSRKTFMTDKDFEKMLKSDEESGSLSDPDKQRRQRKRKRPNSDSDEGNSDAGRRDRKNRIRKQQAKKDQSQQGSEVDDSSGMDGENFEPQKKREKRKRKMVTESDDLEGGSSQHASNSDEESGGSSDSGGQRRKKKKQRPVIPGERKSSRARKANVTMRELTDKEFERMLQQEEKDKAAKKQKRQEKRSSAGGGGNASTGGGGGGNASTGGGGGNASTGGGEGGNASVAGLENSVESGEEVQPSVQKKRPRKPEKSHALREKREGGESGNESDHYWYCELCRDGGDLLLCDTCPKSFHKECLKLEIVPDGEWSCPVCTGEGLPEKGDSSEEDNHETFCRVCKDGGDVILCDFCPMVYHMNCLNPPLKSLPDGDWKCPLCVIKANPPKAKVKTVLTWRWKHQPKDADELDHTHSPQKQPSKRTERELFVKYEYHSYWDCAWIPEQVLEVFQQLQHHSFRRRFDLNEPPALEDGSSFGRPRHKASVSEDDPHNLEERYYRYGIKPEWLQIHRIITHDGKGKDRRYLVKWRDLPYIDCTWEFPDEVPQGLEGFDKHVEAYWTRRKQRARDEKETRRVEIPKKSLLRKKLERQPDYLDETGGALHPYQLEGLNWLRFSWSQGTNTILADEMGLGKTIQAITFLYGLYTEGYVTHKPFLISAPLSTVANWEREFEFWAPDMYVVTYLGQKDNRAVIREQDFCYKEGAFASLHRPCRMRDGFRPKFDVLLTSYEFVSGDFATLSSMEWGVLIIDEAHRLKNNQSLFFRTLSDYKIDYKLLLTGTPLQNNLEELFNLLNFLEPEKFSQMEQFLSEFSEISKDEQVMKLHDMLAPHMLRRMKADVMKDIPSKSEFIVRIELSSMQKKYYKHILTKNYEALNAKGYSHQTSLINIMMDLRKCCNHPYLFPAAEKEAPISVSGMYEGTAMTKVSGKLEMLAKMLKILKRDGHRVLIFSQMTRMLDILEDFLTYHGYGYERIDGSIAGNVRQESIDRFNSAESSHFVFLLSTRAGGLGINLATADTVIIYDMDWNPHNDIQAFSRAHRIGQKNKVMIYRFVTRNTVEEKIAQVCKQKMMLSELIVHRGMGGSMSSIMTEKKDSLTKQEISDILKYGAENLFKDDEEGQVVYSDAAIEKLLDRNQEVEVEKEKEFGMNEYLRSFKVASYQVKEGIDDEEEPEEEKEEESVAEERRENETDVQYWQRVLGPAYHDHVVQTLREQEEVAKTLGKGKRIRKQINYAEKEMMDAAEALSKGKKRAGEEDISFQSDYEPTSDSDDEDASAGDDDGENAGKKRKHLKSGQQVPKGPPVALPPLVERNEGQVLVLGFTARQRRAFLDAVMRYGMPPEDPYRSQWLVRDLRSKPERIFKAYVSLFMRHLCEPIADNAEKFADGVPREGLSRQHVLTRIGIIALIRKKVHEFEDVNGTDSMAEFRPAKPPTSNVKTTDSTSESNKGNGSEKAVEKPAPDESNDKDAEKASEGQVSDEKVTAEEDGKADEKSKGADESTEATNSGSKEQHEGEEAPMEQGEEVQEKEKSDTIEDLEKTVEPMEVDGNDGESTKKKSLSNVDETEGKEEEKEEGQVIEEKEDDAKESEKAKEDAEEFKDKNADGERMETEETTSKEESAKVVEESAKVVEESDEKEKEKEKEVEKEDDKESGAAKESEEAKETTDEPKKDGAESGNGGKEVEDVKKDTTASDPAQPSEKANDVLLTSIKSLAEISAELRRRFWIADGGFTELHSLWHLEEMQLIQSKEYETWHRRHDFWLLAGVITHGYRHWQDILSDPRFDLMNQAFKSDSERTRKAAFLNRRFQLLEQALVIEEQLRKASVENAQNVEPAQEASESSANVTEDKSVKPDHLKPLDDLASSLKNLGQGPEAKGNKNPKLHKVLGHIAALVNDINDMSYTNMPASLAKAYTANAAKPLQQKVMPPMKPSSTPSASSGPWVGGYKPILTAGAQGAKPVYMPVSGYNLGVTSSQSLVPSSSGASTSASGGEKSKDVICID